MILWTIGARHVLFSSRMSRGLAVANPPDAVIRYDAVVARRKTVILGAASQSSRCDVYAHPPDGVVVAYLDCHPAPTCFCRLRRTDYDRGVFAVRARRQPRASSSRAPVPASASPADLFDAPRQTARAGEPEGGHYRRVCTSGAVLLVPIRTSLYQGSRRGRCREGS